MMNTDHAFHRLELLTGKNALTAIQSTPIILFGVGGVGSWCAEALVRSGVQRLAIVDSDLVCVTNINRQVQATFDTVGAVKVDTLRDRLVTINPNATITAINSVFDASTAASFHLEDYAYVIDAIDSLSPKVELIIRACEAGTKVYSALGASSKLDPTRIKVASLWDSHGCPLGHFVRKRLRRRGFTGEVTCIYSDENLPAQTAETTCGTANCVCPRKAADGTAAHEWCSSKKQINGSVVHITGIFGFMLAGLVNQDIIRNATQPSTAPASGVLHLEPDRVPKPEEKQ